MESSARKQAAGLTGRYRDDSASPEASGLVGRGTELEWLEAFLRRVAGDGAVTLLCGDPGIGKTALLEVAAGRARALGMRVLCADGVEIEADIGYSGINQILIGAERDIERLPAGLRQALTVALGLGTGEAADRLVVCNATLALLREAAAEQPVLLLVDDVQWLDRHSATVLGFVGRRLSGHRIGLIVAARSAAQSTFDAAGLEEFEVRPLENDAAAGLLDKRHPNLSEGVRRRVLAEAQGNPLALLELPATLSRSQRVARQALPGVLPLSDRLQELFAARIAGLPEATRRLLLIAVFEATGDLRVLRAAAELAGGPGLDDLGPAEQAQLIRVDDATARISFRHALIRCAVVGMSTHEERRRAHLLLAEASADRPERRAMHLAQAASGPDEEVAALLERTARVVIRRGDAVGAVAALTRAADLSPSGESYARRLAEAAYIGAELGGDGRAAEAMLLTAREASPETEPLHAASAAVFLLLNGDGDVETAHRLLVEAIENGDHGWQASDVALVDALHILMLLCWYGGRPGLWEAFHHALARISPRPPELLALAAKTFPDPIRTAPAALGEVEAVFSRLPLEQDLNRIVRIGTAGVYVDRLGDLRESCWRVVRQCRAGGAIRRRVGSMMHLCLDDFLTGEWDECELLADEALAECREDGFPFFAWYFLYAKSLVAAGRGRFDEAARLTDELIRWAAPRGVRTAEYFALQSRAFAAMGQGDYDYAFRQAGAVSPPGMFAPYVPHCIWAMFDLVEAAVRTGRRGDALAHVRAMREAGIAAVSPRLALIQAGAQVLVAEDEDEARRAFESALSVPGAERWVYDTMRIRLAFGERLRRMKMTGQAREELQTAHDAFQRMGAAPWKARALNELRAAGLQVTGEVETVESPLTPQEEQIARLAATGMTNRQIAERLYLSHRTVGAHLYRIFPKLGISSRAALRDALPEQLTTPPAPGDGEPAGAVGRPNAPSSA